MWLSGLTVHAYPDAIYREFDNGLVLANPSPHSLEFDLEELLPGHRFRRIKGTAQQDPTTNNGEPVVSPLILGPRDALFLIKNR